MIIKNRLINKNEIKDDLKEENYPHIFTFSEDIYDILVEFGLDGFDEVWTFGNVDGDRIYKMAKRDVIDIWEMG